MPLVRRGSERVVDSDLLLFVSSSYVVCHFFTLAILTAVITFFTPPSRGATTTTLPKGCDLPIFDWLQYSSLYNLSACLIAAIVVLGMRRAGMVY